MALGIGLRPLTADEVEAELLALLHQTIGLVAECLEPVVGFAGQVFMPKMPLEYQPRAFWIMGTHWYWYVMSPGRSTLVGACT